MNYIIICFLSIIIAFLIAYILLLKKNIRNLYLNLREFLSSKAAQTHVQLSLLDKDLEKLAFEINHFITDYFKDIYRYKLAQEKIRKEITNISHDLRTPLTSIIGYIDLIEDGNVSENEEKEYLCVIKKKSKTLASLIEDLYEYSRLEGSEVIVNFDKLDFNYIFNEHILSYYDEFEKKGIDIEIIKKDNPLYIEADEKYLNRILNNLTSNTLKYAKKMIYIEVDDIGNEIKVRYKNKNSDLTPYDVKHIFDRFYMKDESRTQNSSGLGLSIAKILVEKMNGKIEANIIDDMICIEFSLKKYHI